jgi:cell division protein FtsB
MPSPVVRPPGLPGAARKPTPEPLRRRKVQQVSHSPRRRRLLNAALLFVAVVLTADALVGEKGLLVTIRARREAQVEAAHVAALRQENARLREEKRRLNEEPSTIEAEARRQLGLAKPGEVMFILKDIRPTDAPVPSSVR